MSRKKAARARKSKMSIIIYRINCELFNTFFSF